MPDDFNALPPATLDQHSHISGPFLHGTAAALQAGDLIEPGRWSHFRPDRPLPHVYFTNRPETAAWGAELASALTAREGGSDAPPARVYEVEPTGPFEDDPNVTDKRFPGNPTRSYRSRQPLRVLAEVVDWPRHQPEELRAMLESLNRLRAEGRDLIED